MSVSLEFCSSCPDCEEELTHYSPEPSEGFLFESWECHKCEKSFDEFDLTSC